MVAFVGLFYTGLVDTQFIVFAFGSFRLLPHIQAIYGAIATIQGARSSYENTLDFLIKSEIPLSDTTTMKNFRPRTSNYAVRSINITDLSFKHDENTVFDTISLTIDLSEKPCMIIGSTGSGKSTLIDLICGLYPTKNENISLDGLSYEALDLNDFQHCISYVSQQFFCRKGRLSQYLKALNWNLDDPHVVELFRQMHLEFLLTGSGVADIMLEENFKNLSGGQRQRVALCLAILRRPSLLILDEATNALDHHTATAVVDYLSDLDIKLIMVTHQPLLAEKFNVLNLDHV